MNRLQVESKLRYLPELKDSWCYHGIPFVYNVKLLTWETYNFGIRTNSWQVVDQYRIHIPLINGSGTLTCHFLHLSFSRLVLVNNEYTYGLIYIKIQNKPTYSTSNQHNVVCQHHNVYMYMNKTDFPGEVRALLVSTAYYTVTNLIYNSNVSKTLLLITLENKRYIHYCQKQRCLDI